MTITTSGRPLVSGEVGRLVDFEGIGFDWAGEGHDLYLRRWESDDPEDYDDYQLSALTDPESGRLTTVAACFPSGQGFRCKLVTKVASVDHLKTEDFTLDVKP